MIPQFSASSGNPPLGETTNGTPTDNASMQDSGEFSPHIDGAAIQRDDATSGINLDLGRNPRYFIPLSDIFKIFSLNDPSPRICNSASDLDFKYALMSISKPLCFSRTPVYIK